jgi:hypothetical protein
LLVPAFWIQALLVCAKAHGTGNGLMAVAWCAGIAAPRSMRVHQQE